MGGHGPQQMAQASYMVQCVGGLHVQSTVCWSTSILLASAKACRCRLGTHDVA
jgi:hypothetical protein